MTFPPWAEIGAERRAHVERVAALLRTWAAAAGVADGERDRWLRAAYLHDALRDADGELLARLAPDAWGVPALRHGPAAARKAREHGETDAGVLDEVAELIPDCTLIWYEGQGHPKVAFASRRVAHDVLAFASRG